MAEDAEAAASMAARVHSTAPPRGGEVANDVPLDSTVGAAAEDADSIGSSMIVAPVRVMKEAEK